MQFCGGSGRLPQSRELNAKVCRKVKSKKKVRVPPFENFEKNIFVQNLFLLSKSIKNYDRELNIFAAVVVVAVSGVWCCGCGCGWCGSSGRSGCCCGGRCCVVVVAVLLSCWWWL